MYSSDETECATFVVTSTETLTPDSMSVSELTSVVPRSENVRLRPEMDAYKTVEPDVLVTTLCETVIPPGSRGDTHGRAGGGTCRRQLQEAGVRAVSAVVVLRYVALDVRGLQVRHRL